MENGFQKEKVKLLDAVSQNIQKYEDIIKTTEQSREGIQYPSYSNS